MSESTGGFALPAKSAVLLAQRWAKADGLPQYWPGCWCGQLVWCDNEIVKGQDELHPADGPACSITSASVDSLETAIDGFELLDRLADAANLPIPKPRPQRRYPLPQGESLISRLKAAYRVEDLAARWTELRGGNTLSGKCPLHNEQHGRSFAVWVDSQRWRCFGKCGIGGDVIDLARAAKERGLSLG